MKPSDHLRDGRSRLLTKFFKFSIVGLSGVGVNSAVLYLLFDAAHLPLLVASPLAVETAIATNFMLNAWWTFQDDTPTLQRFARFNLVALGGMLITVTTLQVLVTSTSLHYQLANLIGIGLGTLWNFGLNLLWTWG